MTFCGRLTSFPHPAFETTLTDPVTRLGFKVKQESHGLELGSNERCLQMSQIQSSRSSECSNKAATEYGIKNFFSQAGRINHVKIYPDQRLKNHIVAYVNVATYKDALDVISEFNNFSFGGSTIRVGFAAPLKPAADTLMQSNYGPGHLALGNSSQLRPSFAGLAQIMSDVERLNTTPDHRKVEILEFRRLQPSSEVIDRLIQQPVCDWAVPVKAEQRNNAAEKAGTENTCNNDCDSGLLPGTGATEQPSGNLN